MSKQVRIELEIAVRIYVGENLPDESKPAEMPDLADDWGFTRVAHVGPMVPARDVGAAHLTALLSGAIPGTVEHVRQQLRERGF